MRLPGKVTGSGQGAAMAHYLNQLRDAIERTQINFNNADFKVSQTTKGTEVSLSTGATNSDSNNQFNIPRWG